MRRRLVLVLISAVLCGGCAGVRYSAWRTFTHDGRLQKQSDRAWLLLDAGRAAEADEAYRKLRARAPDDPFEAYAHARALVALGRMDEAWSALEAAIAAGFRDTWRLERDTRLAPLREDARFASFEERVEENLHRWNARVAEARRPADPGAAPTFDSWARLNDSIREENGKAYRLLYSRDPTGERELAAHRIRQRNLAAIRRYLADHPAAKDREEATLGEIKERVSIAQPWSEVWPVDEASAIEQAAGRFLEAYPASASRSAVELHRAVAVLRAVLPADGPDPARKEPYEPDCAKAVPLLETLAAGAEGDPRGAEAEGFLATCLWKVTPRDEARALALAQRFLERDESGEAEWSYPMLPADVRKVRLLAGSLPPFEAKDLAGNTWTSEGMKGRVSILQFWSPG